MCTCAFLLNNICGSLNVQRAEEASDLALMVKNSRLAVSLPGIAACVAPARGPYGGGTSSPSPAGLDWPVHPAVSLPECILGDPEPCMWNTVPLVSHSSVRAYSLPV